MHRNLIQTLSTKYDNFRLWKYGTRDSCWTCLQHSLCYDWNTIYSVCDRWCWADFCHTCFISLGQNQANSDANHGICQVSFVTVFCPKMSLYYFRNLNENHLFFAVLSSFTWQLTFKLIIRQKIITFASYCSFNFLWGLLKVNYLIKKKFIK